LQVAQEGNAALVSEQQRAASLQQRLYALEQQVANLPAESIRGRLRLNAAFDEQRKGLEAQLAASQQKVENLAGVKQQAAQHSGATTSKYQLSMMNFTKIPWVGEHSNFRM
jgi:hypothetical protein